MKCSRIKEEIVVAEECIYFNKYDIYIPCLHLARACKRTKLLTLFLNLFVTPICCTAAPTTLHQYHTNYQTHYNQGDNQTTAT